MKSLNEAAIAQHLDLLEATFTDATAFPRAFEALQADKAMKAPEMKALAKRFAKHTARSKKQALNYIWGRHYSLMLARAKAAATDGRTAG